MKGERLKVKGERWNVKGFVSWLKNLSPFPFHLSLPAKRGMTLVEVLAAIMILGVGLTAIMVSLSQCMGLMLASKEYLDAQWVLGLGELKNPIRETDDVKEKVPVAAESLDELLNDEMKKRRYMFEREVEEKPDDTDIEDDGLYVVKSRVYWGGVRYRGYKGSSEEIVRLVLEKK